MSNYKYLHIQDQDRRWGIVTTTVGQQKIEPGEVYPATDHPRRYYFSAKDGRVLQEYHIVYITKGQGWFESASLKKTQVQAGDVLLLFPGEWHNYAPAKDTGWEESWVGFTGEYADHLMNAGFFNPKTPIIRIGVQDTIYRYFAEACTIAMREWSAGQQAMGGLVAAILGGIYAAGKQYASRSYNSETIGQIDAAKKYMRDNTHIILAMEDVAEHVRIGYSRFRKLFKTYTGLSPAAYYQGIKFSQAKSLLTNSDLTCQEIAFQLGYESASFFNTIFHKKEKMTPLAYRKMTRSGK